MHETRNPALAGHAGPLDGRRCLVLAGLYTAAFATAPGAVAAKLGGVTLDSGRRIAVARSGTGWRAMRARHTRQSARADAATRMNLPSDPGATAWKGLLARLERQPPLQRISETQTVCNGYPYRSDNAGFGRGDYWATPREFFAQGTTARISPPPNISPWRKAASRKRDCAW